LALADMNAVRVGEEVLFAGYPLDAAMIFTPVGKTSSTWGGGTYHVLGGNKYFPADMEGCTS